MFQFPLTGVDKGSPQENRSRHSTQSLFRLSSLW